MARRGLHLSPLAGREPALGPRPDGRLPSEARKSGEGVLLYPPTRGECPLTRIAARSDLSPQAGRGDHAATLRCYCTVVDMAAVIDPDGLFKPRADRLRRHLERRALRVSRAGLHLVIRSTGLINFAQGDMMMLGGMLTAALPMPACRSAAGAPLAIVARPSQRRVLLVCDPSGRRGDDGAGGADHDRHRRSASAAPSPRCGAPIRCMCSSSPAPLRSRCSASVSCRRNCG